MRTQKFIGHGPKSVTSISILGVELSDDIMVQHQGPFSLKQMNQRGTWRVIVTMCWICGYTGYLSSISLWAVRENLAYAILTVEPNSNQMGSRVAITHASIIPDYGKYTLERQIRHLLDTIASSLTVPATCGPHF